MRSAVVAALALWILAACSGEAPTGTEAPGEEAPAAESAPEAADIEVTAGDVEQKIYTNATIMEPDRGPTVKVDEVADARGRINLVTVDVYRPYPEQLPVTFRTVSMRNWMDTPVAIRGKVVAEGRPETFAETLVVYGKEAARNDLETKVDLMQALPEPPDTLLLLWKADAVLLPRGTDEATVDPATATASEERTTQLMSNAVRVNFHDEPAPGAGESAAPAPAPAAAAPEPAPAPVEPAPAPAQ